jgi:hypothetical protein
MELVYWPLMMKSRRKDSRDREKEDSSSLEGVYTILFPSHS